MSIKKVLKIKFQNLSGLQKQSINQPVHLGINSVILYVKAIFRKSLILYNCINNTVIIVTSVLAFLEHQSAIIGQFITFFFFKETGSYKYQGAVNFNFRKQQRAEVGCWNVSMTKTTLTLLATNSPHYKDCAKLMPGPLLRTHRRKKLFSIYM